MIPRLLPASVVHIYNDMSCIRHYRKNREQHSTLTYYFYKKIEKRQLWVRPMGGWNSTLQAACYVRHAHWARLCYVPFVIQVWCLWITSTIWLLILISTICMVGRSRVFYMYFSWKVGRWLPWVPQGSTGWFHKDDVVHNHSAHGYYITRIEGGNHYRTLRTTQRHGSKAFGFRKQCPEGSTTSSHT